MNIEMNKLLDELKEFDEVVSVVLGGSRSGENFDDGSDYDLYIYTKEPLPEEKRNALYEKYCTTFETGNHYFEYEDNIILKNGVHSDIIYRRLADIERYLTHVIDGGRAFSGYTTCFWHNIIRSRILCDKDGSYEALQKKYDIPYPQKLRDAIIRKNMNLLHGCLPSYDKQIMKAIARDDIVSINHRTTAFVESYFDVIFAMNEKTHPGEKKLIDICKKECRLLPANFEDNLRKLYHDIYADTDSVREDLENIVKELETVLTGAGLWTAEAGNEK